MEPQLLGNRLSQPASTLRLLPLALTGAVGVALIALHIVLEFSPNPPKLSGLVLELGAGVLLFAVLFVVQVRAVERAVSAARALTEDDMGSTFAEGRSNPLTPGDFYDDAGPLALASVVLRGLAAGNLRDVWWLFDANLRRCRALAWLYNNRHALGLADASPEDVDRLASELADLNELPGGLTDQFMSSERDQYRDALHEFGDDGWGWSQRRRVVGPDHEMVIAVRLPADAPFGIIVERPTIVPHALTILVSRRAVGGLTHYEVAGINCDAAPLPTWPPTWWIVDDPAAVAAHAGLRAS